MKALSIRQPWAWLIVNGHKRVENRTWRTQFRGEFLVHASTKFDRRGYLWAVNKFGLDLGMPLIYDFTKEPGYLGGIVGIANMIDCRPVDPKGETDPFFFGPYGFIIDCSVAIPYQPYKGKLGFFDIEVESPWSE